MPPLPVGPTRPSPDWRDDIARLVADDRGEQAQASTALAGDSPVTEAEVEARPPSAARGTLQLLIARTCFLVSGMVISIILARTLGPVAFGTYGVIISLSSWLQLVLNGGVPGATIKLLAEHPARAAAISQTARAVLLAAALVLAVPAFFASPEIVHLLGLPTAATAFRVALLDLALMSLYFAYQGTLYGHGRIGTLATSLILHTLLKLLVILTLTFVGLSVTTAVLAQAVGTFGVLVFLSVMEPPGAARPAADMARAMIRISLPLTVYGMALQIHTNLVLWLFSAVGNDSHQTGFLVATANLSRTFTVVQAVLAGLVFASISQALAGKDEARARHHLSEGMRFALLLVAPAAALLIIDARPVMVLLFGSGFAPAASLLRWQVVTVAAMPFLDLGFMALAAGGRTGFSTRLLAGLIPVLAGLALLLGHTFGAIGMVAAQAGVVVAATVMTGLATWQRYRSFLPLPSLFRIAAATLVVALLSSRLSVDGPAIIIKIAVLFAIWAAILVALRELTLEDLRALGVKLPGRRRA